MDENMGVDLQAELIADLTLELQGEETFNPSVLTQKVINAIRDVRSARKYPSYYTDERIKRDLYEYYSTIRAVAEYDYNLVGAEGETSHSENGVSRAYVKRQELFADVLPLAKL